MDTLVTFPSRGEARLAARRRRKLRKAINCVVFCCIVNRRLADRRWGDHVEEVDNVLLESSPRDIPASYFETMGQYPLPPGWVTGNLPIKVQHQIRTYAKNKIVRLLTPIARLKALRTQLRASREAFIAQRGPKGGITTKILKTNSSFFDLWSESQLRDLLDVGRVVCYRSGMWVYPCAKTPKVNAFVVLAGAVCEVRNNGLGKEPTQVAEFFTNSIVADTRCILSSPSTNGYVARSNSTIVLEFPWMDVEKICFVAPPAPPPTNMATSATSFYGGARSAHHPSSSIQQSPASQMATLRKFIINQRQQQMYRHFPLSVKDLKQLILFAKWDEGDLQHLIQSVKAKVYFEGEEIMAQGSNCTEAIIVCRGNINVLIDGKVRRILEPEDSFGEDSMVFEEKCPATLVANTTCECWYISRTAVFSHLKSTALRKLVYSSAVELRERFLEQIRDRAYLAMRLRDTPEFCKMNIPEDVFVELEQHLKAKVCAAGDRFATGGDDITALVIVESGKINENTVDRQVTTLVPPCVLGGRFLMRQKWAASMTAVRNSECWVLERKDAIQVLKQHPALLHRLQNMKLQRRNTIALDAHQVSQTANRRPSQRALITSQTTKGKAPNLRSEERASVRQHIKTVRDEEEQEVLRLEERREANRRALVAPPDPDHLSMFEYEGLQPIQPAPKQVYTQYRATVRHQSTPPKKEEDVVVIRDTSKGIVLLKEDTAALAECKPRVQKMLAAEVRRLENRATARRGSGTNLQGTSSPMKPPGSPRTNKRKTRYAAINDNNNSFGFNAHRPSSATAAQGLQPTPPSGTAEKTVFKDIIKRHNAKISDQRQRCANEAELGAVISANPFSNFKRRKEPLHKMSPLGELYLQSATTAKETKSFDPKSYDRVIAPSYVSAHGFSELDTYGGM